MNKAVVLSIMLIGLNAGASDVEKTVQQKNGWATYQSEIDRKVGTVNEKCASKIRASYDKSTYPSFDPIQDRTQAACQAAVGTLANLCVSDAGKQAVQKIKTSSCQFSTSGTGVAFKEGALIVRIDPKNSNITGKSAGSYSWKSALEEVL